MGYSASPASKKTKPSRRISGNNFRPQTRKEVDGWACQGVDPEKLGKFFAELENYLIDKVWPQLSEEQYDKLISEINVLQNLHLK